MDIADKAIESRITKLRHFREWYRETPYMPSVFMMWASGNIANAVFMNYPTLGVNVVAGALGIVAAGTLAANIVMRPKNVKTLVKDYHFAFSSEKQAKRVIVNALTVAANVLDTDGRTYVAAALHTIWNNIQHDRASNRTTKLLSGCELGGNILPNDDTAALKIIMREVCDLYIRRTFGFPDESFGINPVQLVGSEKLPTKLQGFISHVYPELVCLNPERFDNGILDAFRPGLSHVVQSLLAMSCGSDEFRTSVREWLDSIQSTGNTRVANEDLPLDIM